MHKEVLGRFAPSPTGRMHAGNIFAALNAWLVAKSQGGKILLRIEDLDGERSKREYADSAMRDFESLGLTWDVGPVFQSQRDESYSDAYERICAMANVYPCFCTRADLSAQSAPQVSNANELSDNRLRGCSIYSGKCRGLLASEAESQKAKRKEQGRGFAMRLEVPDVEVSFEDLFQGQLRQSLSNECGDFVLRRADGGFAYQLAVVVDDAEQGVNSVVRGFDLLDSTPRQIMLCEMLGHDVPEYGHVPLFCAADGRRLAKRDKDAEYPELLKRYGSPEGVLGHIAFIGGLSETDEPASAEDLLSGFSIAAARDIYRGRKAIIFE